MNKVRKEILQAQLDEVEKKIALYDIDIQVLQSIDPEHIVRREKLSANSSKEITAEEALDKTKKDREGVIIRRTATLKLLEG